jgi:hypothetical protein
MKEVFSVVGYNGRYFFPLWDTTEEVFSAVGSYINYITKYHKSQIYFFSLYVFFANQRSIFHNFFLCCPSQRSARGQVPSQVATHQEMGNQLWGGETPDSNPGLQIYFAMDSTVRFGMILFYTQQIFVACLT